MKDSTVNLRSEPSDHISKITVYTPSGADRQRGGFIALLKRPYVYRELIWQLVYRDFSVRYRQSIMGYLWAIAFPLVAVGMFAFLSRYRVLPMGNIEIPYIAFGIWSFSVWQLFVGCLINSTSSLSNAGTLVTKLNFPKDTLVIAAAGQPVFDFLIRILLVAAVFIWYQVVPGWQAIYIPLLLLPLVLLAIGFGFFLSVANLVARDFSKLVAIFAMFGMFLAPVLYPPPVRWPFTLVNTLNPVSPILIATQDLIIKGQILRPGSLVIAIVFALTVFFVGWRVFTLVLPRAIERA
jgi:lipopolysaccharide transport system permease protein